MRSPAQEPDLQRLAGRRRSIRGKITRIIVSALLAAMGLTFVLSAWISIRSGLRSAQENLQTIAVTTEKNLQAPLAFNDSLGVQEVLQSLQGNPAIARAEVRNPNHALLAQFAMAPPEKGSAWMQQLPVPHEETVDATIVLDGKVLGFLKIHANLDPVWESEISTLLKTALVYAAGLLAAAWLARRLAIKVAAPITQAAHTAAVITRDGNYALRINVVSEDEVGHLGTAFNQLLDAVAQREHALRTSETRLHTLLDALPDLVWFKDVQGQFEFCNPRVEQMLGATEKEIVGKTDYDFVAKEHADSFRANDLKAMTHGGVKVNEEWVTFASDGHKELLETAKLALRDHDDQLIGVLGIGHDITARKQAEQHLRRTNEQLKAILQAIPDLMFELDLQGRYLNVWGGHEDLLAASRAELLGKTVAQVLPLPSAQTVLAALAQANAMGTSFGQEIKLALPQGERWFQLSVAKRSSDDEEKASFVVLSRDMTAAKNAAEQIRTLAFYDPLTALPNRRLLLDRLALALASSARRDVAGGLLFIDLDHFKTINDTLGHDVGDQLLQQVASRLAHCIREGDTVARLGGDEFVVMLENLAESDIDAAAQTKAVGTKILATLKAPYLLGEREFHSTASMGATLFRGHHTEIEELLRQADIAMYQCKNAGRNGLRFFDPEMQVRINQRARLEDELRQGLDLKQFRLHYQVQVDSSERAVGAEALLRWLHPSRGMVSPGEFIALAEENGLILPIGLWVLETACAQLHSWQQHAATSGLTLAVNISARQFRQTEFVVQVQSAIERYAIRPQQLKLELTESVLLDNVDQTILTMHALKNLGVGFSLDDFGTGFSSLQYIKKLPLTQLKIDQSFVRDLARDDNDKAIVRTIIAMAHSMHLDVISEGVETEQQRTQLLKLGCRHFQGYLFGKPVSAMKFESSLHVPS